jgi:hypothetical protein
MSDNVVDSAISAFSAAQSVDVTPDAQNFIKGLVAALHSDPHPSWGTAGDALRQRYSAVDELQGLLERAWIDEGSPSTVSTFDVVHWISKHLSDVSLPVEKTSQVAVRRVTRLV